MNKQQEALKLALEAIEACLNAGTEAEDQEASDMLCDARKAIRSALAEKCVCGEPDTPGTHRTDGPCLAEQRPQNCGTGYCSCIECPYEQPASKPVAMRYDFDGYGYKYIDAGSGSDWQTRIKDAEPVYTSPQPAQQQKPVAALQRVMARLADLLDEDQFAEIEGIVVSAGVAPPASKPWVGLTDEEMKARTQSPFVVENYRAIEAKLREKNT